MPNKKLVLAACVLQILLSNIPNSFGDQQQTPDGVKAAIRENWEEYRKKLERFEGKYKLSRLLSSKNQTSLTEVEFKRYGDLIVYIAKHPDHRPQAGGANSQYCFRLESPTMTAEKWVLSSVLFDRKNGQNDNEQNKMQDALMVALRNPDQLVATGQVAPLFCFAHSKDRPLGEMVKGSGFTFNKVEDSVVEGDKKMPKVHFDCEAGNAPISGWVVLDPQNYWCIKEFDVKTIHGKTSIFQHLVLTYEITASGIPLPISRIGTIGYKPQNADRYDYQVNDEFLFKEVKTKPSEREFMMTAFGLPEPPGSEPVNAMPEEPPPGRFPLVPLFSAFSVAVLLWLSLKYYRHKTKATS